MEERYKSTPADDALISDRSADEIERSDAMIRIAFDGIYRLKTEIAAQLDDPSVMVRGEAIRVLLGRWQLDAYLEHALDMLRAEPDEDGRADAALALGWFIALRPPEFPVDEGQRDVIMPALVQAFLDDPSRYVQEVAYCQLHEVLTGRRAALPEQFNPETDADWEMLAPYVPAERIPPARPRPAPVSSDEDMRVLRDDTASPEARVAAMERLGADRRYDAAWPVERLRDHDSPLLRGRALLELVRTWRYETYPQVREMLESDPGWEARAAAAEAVPYLLQAFPAPGNREHFREVLVLALIRENDERVDLAIRKAIERLDDPAFPGK
jgi:HEAT repeat protein